MMQPELFSGDDREPRHGGELTTSRLLGGYLRDQFDDARAKEQSELRRQTGGGEHGRFYKKIDSPMGPQETKGSMRIIMKPPHPDDRPGCFWEVFELPAVLNDDYDFVHEYILRGHVDGEEGPFLLTSPDGVLEMGEIAPGIYEPIIPDDPRLPDALAAEIFQTLSAHNIVASNE